MKRIYLLRHGECGGKGTYVGRGLDLSLTGEGRRQVSSLAGQLGKTIPLNDKDCPVRIITSSLQRARETGAILADALPHLPNPVIDDRLDEIDFGAWEGLGYAEICRDYPAESQAWFDDPWEKSPPGGEASRDFADRVSHFHADLITSFQGEDRINLIVGHGGSLRLLLCLFLGVDPRNQWVFKLDRGGWAGLDLVEGTPVLFHLE